MKKSHELDFGIFATRQKAYHDDALSTKKDLDNLRYLHLRESFERAYNTVIQDELVHVLKTDHTTQDLVSLRVREIYETVINSDRETLLEKMMLHYSDVKEAVGRLESDLLNTKQELEKSYEENKVISEEIEKILKENNSLREIEESLRNEFEEFEQKNQDALCKIKEKEANEQHALRQRIECVEGEVKEKSSRIWQLEKEKVELSEKLSSLMDEKKILENSVKKIKNEYNEIESKKNEIDEENKKLQDLTQQLQDSLAEKTEECKDFLEKCAAFEETIANNEKEYMQNMDQLRQEYDETIKCNEDQITHIKISEEAKIGKIKKKLQLKITELEKILKEKEELKGEFDHFKVQIDIKTQTLIEEYEEKCSQISEDNQNKIQEMQNFLEEQIAEQRDHYERILQTKVKELEKESLENIRKLRLSENQLREQCELKMKEVEQNYVTRSNMADILNEKDKMIATLKDEIIRTEESTKEYYEEKIKGIENMIFQTQEEYKKRINDMGRDSEDKIKMLQNQQIEAIKNKDASINDLKQVHNTEIKNLTKKLVKAEEELSSAKVEIDNFVIKLKEIKEEKKMFKGELSYSEQEKDVLKNKIENFEKLFKINEQDKLASKVATQARDKLIEEKEQEIFILQNSLNQIEEKFLQFEKHTQNLEQTIKQYQQAEKSKSDESAILCIKIDELQNEILELKQEKSLLNEELKNINNKYLTLEEKSHNLENSCIVNKEKALKKQRALVQKLKQTTRFCSDIKSELKYLKKEWLDSKMLIHKLKETIQRQIISLFDSLLNACMRRRQIVEEVQKSEWIQILEEERINRTNLQSELQMQIAESQNLHTENLSLRADYEKVNGELAQIKSKYIKMKSKLKEKDQQISILNQNCLQKIKFLEISYNEKLSKSSDEIQKLKQTFDQLRDTSNKKLKNLDSKLLEYQEICNNKMMRIEELTNERDNFKMLLNEAQKKHENNEKVSKKSGSITPEVGYYTKKLEELENKISNLNDEMIQQTLRSREEDLGNNKKNYISKLENEVANKNKQYESIETENKKLKCEMNDLRILLEKKTLDSVQKKKRKVI